MRYVINIEDTKDVDKSQLEKILKDSIGDCFTVSEKAQPIPYDITERPGFTNNGFEFKVYGVHYKCPHCGEKLSSENDVICEKCLNELDWSGINESICLNINTEPCYKSKQEIIDGINCINKKWHRDAFIFK